MLSMLTNGKTVILVVEHEEGIGFISNSDHTVFIKIIPTFMELS